MRNPMVLHGGDEWSRVLLFFAMFLPLDRAWAIRRSPSAPDAEDQVHPTRRGVLSAATFAHWAVVTTLYLRNWVSKRQGICWNEQYCAVQNGFGAADLASPIGLWLRDMPTVCMYLTIGTMAMEGPM